MAKDGTPAGWMPHPSWCDRTSCTIDEGANGGAWPYGLHQSESTIVPADPPVGVVAELHLTSTPRGFSPGILLMIEFDIDGEPDDDLMPVSLPLTLRQARDLHTALDKLIGTVGG